MFPELRKPVITRTKVAISEVLYCNSLRAKLHGELFSKKDLPADEQKKEVKWLCITSEKLRLKANKL